MTKECEAGNHDDCDSWEWDADFTSDYPCECKCHDLETELETQGEIK